MKDIKNYKSPWFIKLWAFFFADQKHFTIQDNKLVRVVY